MTSALRSLRTEAGFTQEQLAELSGLSQPSISAVERGRYGLQLSSAARVARALSEPLGRSPSDIAGELVMAADLPPLQSDPSEHCTEAA